MKDYQPIDCGLVDHIEHFATLKKEVTISYLNGVGKPATINAVIVDWVNSGGDEYMILKNSLRIRLDNILQIDDIDFRQMGTCQTENFD